MECDSYTVSPTHTITITRSGARIDLQNPNVDNIPITDIAHQLSHICRWGGIPEHFFSVAEHCIMTAALAPPEDKLEALMHDCEEAILGDNITPLKYMIPQLVDLGNLIRDLFYKKFGVNSSHDRIKIYDKKQLDWEYENIIQSNTYVGCSPQVAKALFIKKFKEYSELNKNSNNNKMERSVVFQKIEQERDYQHKRWEDGKREGDKSDAQKDVAEWIIYMHEHLRQAESNVYTLDKEEALASIRKVAALAVACLEVHGCPDRITK
jgi:5'-deoxynucleotidase YfbR-like HD superfamily hydrolase